MLDNSQWMPFCWGPHISLLFGRGSVGWCYIQYQPRLPQLPLYLCSWNAATQTRLFNQLETSKSSVHVGVVKVRWRYPIYRHCFCGTQGVTMGQSPNHHSTDLDRQETVPTHSHTSWLLSVRLIFYCLDSRSPMYAERTLTRKGREWKVFTERLSPVPTETIAFSAL